MNGSVRRRLGAMTAAGCLFLVLASPVGATVSSPCSATGTSTSGGDVDLTTAKEWHLKKADVAGGHGESTAEMKSATVSAYALGLPIPIASGSGDGGTTGAVQGVSVEPFTILGARFVVGGSASGDSGGCTGQIVIIIDDVNPVTTALGGGGGIAAVIGAIALILGARAKPGLGRRILSGIFGLLGGAGLGLLLEQLGVIDPTTFVGLGIAIVGLVVGLLIQGRLHGGSSTPDATPAPA